MQKREYISIQDNPQSKRANMSRHNVDYAFGRKKQGRFPVQIQLTEISFSHSGSWNF